MKRSPLKRTGFKSKKIAPGVQRMRRTRIRKVGAQKKREAAAEAYFRNEVRKRDKVCQLCPTGGPLSSRLAFGIRHPGTKLLGAHHLCGKGRGRGHPELHNPENGILLCSFHHIEEVHRGLHPELLKPVSFLDSLTKE